MGIQRLNKRASLGARHIAHRWHNAQLKVLSARNVHEYRIAIGYGIREW